MGVYLGVKGRQDMAKLSRDFILQSTYVLFGAVSHRGLSLIAMILVARTLEATDYGMLTYMTTASLTIAPLVALGVTQILIREIAKFAELERVRETFAASFSIVFISFFLFYPILVLGSQFWPDAVGISAEFLSATYLLAGSTIMLSLTGAFFTALGKTKYFSRVQAFQGAISIPTYFLGAKYAGILGVLIAIALTNIIVVCIALPHVRHCLSLGRVFSRPWFAMLGRYLKSSFPIALNDSGFALLNFVTISFILQASSEVELALFMAAIHWQMIGVFIPTAISGVVLRFLAMQTREGESASAFFWWNLAVQLGYGLALMLAVAVFGGFIEVLYGPSFEGLSSLLVIAVGASVPMVALNLVYHLGVASSKSHLITSSRVGVQLLTLIVTILLMTETPTAMSALFAKAGSYMIVILILAIGLAGGRLTNR